MTKTVYSYNKNGYYSGKAIAHRSPLEEDVYIMPANSTEVEPPDQNSDKIYKWINEKWVEEKKIPEVTERKPSDEELLAEKRAEKYFEVEVIRKNQQFQPVFYQKFGFSTSQMARQNMSMVISILSEKQNEKYPWSDIKNAVHQFELKDFQNIVNKILTRDSELYLAEAQIKNQLDKISELKVLQLADAEALWKKEQ